MSALEEARKTKGKPTMIIADTIPGKGVSFVEKDYKWHGKAPTKEEGDRALAEIAEERKRIEQER